MLQLTPKNNLWLFFWQFFFSEDERRPNNICSLFWGGLIGGLLYISSPIMGIAAFIYHLATRKHGNTSHIESVIEFGSSSFVYWLVDKFILVCWNLVSAITWRILHGDDTWPSDGERWKFFLYGFLSLLGGLVVLIIVLLVIWAVKLAIDSIKSYYKNKKFESEVNRLTREQTFKEPNVAVLFFRSIKDKTCVLINWK